MHNRRLGSFSLALKVLLAKHAYTTGVTPGLISEIAFAYEQDIIPTAGIPGLVCF
jgi:hypothetical protein